MTTMFLCSGGIGKRNVTFNWMKIMQIAILLYIVSCALLQCGTNPTPALKFPNFALSHVRTLRKASEPNDFFPQTLFAVARSCFFLLLLLNIDQFVQIQPTPPCTPKFWTFCIYELSELIECIKDLNSVFAFLKIISLWLNMSRRNLNETGI